MTRAGFRDYNGVRAAGRFGFVAAWCRNAIVASPELSHAVPARRGADPAAVGEGGGGAVPRPDRAYHQPHRAVRPEVPHDPIPESDLRGWHLYGASHHLPAAMDSTLAVYSLNL
jgi:hypothetical protein